MKPEIKKTEFGSITTADQTFEHDIIIRLDGRVKKRKKKLSKAIYVTSHIVSLDEMQEVYEKGAEEIIIGSGKYGELRLSDEAKKYLKDRKCRIELEPTPEAIKHWNSAKAKAVGLFHVTC